MARHNELLKEFKLIIENGFDWLSEEHRESVCIISDCAF